MKKTLIAFSFFLAAGCATTPPKPFPLVEADYEAVRVCRPVEKYPGPSGHRLWGPPAVIAGFKYDTAVKAKAKGATHIYWREDVEGIEGGITGYAVDCTGILENRPSDREDGE